MNQDQRGRGCKTAKSNGLTVTVYSGVGEALLAFDLASDKGKGLAGFSVLASNGKQYYLPNRLGFNTRYDENTTEGSLVYTPSNEAPIQKFRWTHVFGDSPPSRYTVSALYFATGKKNLLYAGATVDIDMTSFLITYSNYDRKNERNETLQSLLNAVGNAESSIVFSLANNASQNEVLEGVRQTFSRGVLSYGVSQTGNGVTSYHGNPFNGLLTPAGSVLKQSFFAIDFNGANPTVYTLRSNGTFTAIDDGGVASAYAVEALSLADHYHFRAVLRNRTTKNPVALRTDDWSKNCFDTGSLKSRERALFANGPSGEKLAKVIPFPSGSSKSQSGKKKAA